MPEFVRILLTLAVGVGTGILSGMFGIGGAVISTPAIRALGVGPLDAVGTTLPSIFPSAVSGTLRYRRERLIRWPVVAVCSTVGTASAVGGSLLSHVVPGHGHWLMIATAILVAFTAWRMIRTDEPVDESPSLAPGREVLAPARTPVAKLVTTGLAAGGLSGLLGVGGGIIMVPAFTDWMGFGIKEAVATSLACVGVLAIPSTITHTFLGDIDWSFAIPLCIGVIPGARLGAHLAIRAPERALRITVATVLLVIAAIYAATEIAALH